jgi:hypothetical protein
MGWKGEVGSGKREVRRRKSEVVKKLQGSVDICSEKITTPD